MALNYYMDVNVPSAITEGLRRRNIDVLTSQEDGTRRNSDEFLLERATKLERILFSQDQDLLRIANQWQTQGLPFSGVVFANQQGVSIGMCVEDLELLAHYYSREEMSNQVIFIPLR